MSMTTWRQELEQVRDGEEIIAYAPNQAAFDIEFDAGYGGTNGPPVLAWSDTRVFFPVVYDGAEWLGSAPRNPQADGQGHEGGG